MAFIVGLFWFLVVCLGLIALCYAFVAVCAIIEQVKNPAEPSMAAQELGRQFEKIADGQINSALICTHCQTAGQVRTKMVHEKKGISGGKATAALITGGVNGGDRSLAKRETHSGFLWEL